MEIKKHDMTIEWIKVGIRRDRREIEKFIEINEKENKTYQNLWDVGKNSTKRNFTAIKSYIKNIERFQI
jgi:hypothetical protein